MRRFIFVLLGALSVAPAFAQDPPEPWGYVYAFRTLRVYALTLEDNRIGRLAENPVALSSARVSRRHAAIKKKTMVCEFFREIVLKPGTAIGGCLLARPMIANLESIRASLNHTFYPGPGDRAAKTGLVHIDEQPLTIRGKTNACPFTDGCSRCQVVAK